MIVAVLIVKNESHVLERCLRSVLPHVDGVLVSDTGSDNLQKFKMKTIIDVVSNDISHAKAIILCNQEWQGFAGSRNRALEQAVDEFKLTAEDWLFMIDADDYVEAWEAPSDSWRTGYHVTMRGDGCTYPRVQLFQVLGAWRYVGVIHEFPEAGSVGHVGTLKTIVRSTREGARNRDPQKYLRDAELIEAELAKGVDDELLKRRYTFYLAQSYRDAGEPAKASEQYWQRSTMGGYAEEVYVSILEGMRLKYAYDLFDDMDEPGGLTDRLRKAQETCPHRRECVWQMMRWLREHERWNDVVMLYLLYPPVAASPDGLFIELTAYNYGMHDEAGVAYYWLGDYAKSLIASLTALAAYPDKHGDIGRLIANLEHAARKL